MHINNEPWFTHGAIKFLEKILNKNMVIMEYGAGGSTGWFAQRTKHLISIEHNKKWYNSIYNYLRSKNINNVDLMHIGLYSGYINIIDHMGLFDFISIDGRKRSECIQHAHTHVNIGGYILLDDAERKGYQRAIKIYLARWKRFDFRDKKITSIFQRK